MLTYEDMTGLFLRAAGNLDLVTHPEFWLNTRSLEREFTCTCHIGSCDDVELQSSCTIAFTWGALDTALSLEGTKGVCEFFHDADNDCPHLHTSAIPPLVLDLAYSLVLNGASLSEDTLLSLTQMLKLRASEQSRRTIETRPSISMVLHEKRLVPETLNVQQRVEIPIWHPLGIHGLHDDAYSVRSTYSAQPSRKDDHGEGGALDGDDPHPEDWLPRVLVEVCQDIVQVLTALDAAVSCNSSDL